MIHNSEYILNSYNYIIHIKLIMDTRSKASSKSRKELGGKFSNNSNQMN